VQGGRTLREIEVILDDLVRFYHERRGGFQLEYLPGMGYQFRTALAAAPVMERMFASRPRPLSRSAQETLAIIAYRQPTTRAEIERVRGVDAGSIIKALLDKNLIECVGRKNEIGRPMLFGTTEEFLRVYGLGHIKDLPPLMSVQPSMDIIKAAEKRIEGASAVDPGDFGSEDDDTASAEMDFAVGLGFEPTSGEVDQRGSDQG
jgi:segregation and condensation protein B